MKIPRGSGVVSNRVTSTGSVETSQTHGALSTFSNAMGIVQQWNNQRDHAQTQEAINTAIKKTNDWKVQNMARTGKDAQGITQDYLKFNQDLESDLSQNLSNNAKEAFNGWNMRNAESDRMEAMVHEKKQDDYVKESAFNDGLNIAQETIRTDARSWQKAAEHLNTTLELGKESGVIKEEEFDAKKTEITNKFRNELGKSYYTQDKHEFMKNIDQFGFGKPEVEFYKDKYQKDLAAEQREKKVLFAEEARTIYGQRDDMKAQALANEDTSHYFENAKKLKDMGYHEWSKNLEEDGNLYKNVIAFYGDNKNKSLKEISESAQALSVPTKLDGSSSEFKANIAIQKEVKQQLKVYNSDPAQYVQKWAAGSTMEEIASSRLSLQEKQGIYPQKGFQILTSDEKKNFKGAWESGDNKQRTELVLNSSRYGKHTAKVLEEVGVNSSLALAPLLNDEKDIEMLVSGVSTKPEVLDDTKKSSYSTAAKNSDFYQTLLKVQAAFPTNTDLPQKIKDVESAMIGIGARKVDPEAGAKFFDEHLSTLESKDKLVYFPKTVDEDEVATALDKKKFEIISRFKNGDGIKDMSSRWAVRDAMWVNTTNGFVLMDSRSGSYIPGSEMDMLELDTLRKDLVKAKASESALLTQMRRK